MMLVQIINVCGLITRVCICISLHVIGCMKFVQVKVARKECVCVANVSSTLSMCCVKLDVVRPVRGCFKVQLANFVKSAV